MQCLTTTATGDPKKIEGDKLDMLYSTKLKTSSWSSKRSNALFHQQESGICTHMKRVIWNAKLTYIQINVPIFKYLDLGTNHLYLSSNHLYLATNHLHLGTNDLKIGINDLYLGSNDLYLSSNTSICT